MNELKAKNIIKQHWNFSDTQIDEAKKIVLENKYFTEAEVEEFLAAPKPEITEEQEKRWKKSRRNQVLKMLGVAVAILLIRAIQIYFRSR